MAQIIKTLYFNNYLEYERALADTPAADIEDAYWADDVGGTGFPGGYIARKEVK